MNILQINLSAAVLIIAVVLVRSLTLHRLPKKTFLLLWGIVVCRLLLPFSIPSPFSFYTGLDTLKRSLTETTTSPFPVKIAGIPALTSMPVKDNPVTVSVASVSASPVTLIWLVGLCACALFFIVAYIKYRREFRTSLPVTNEFAARLLREHPLRRLVQIRESDRIAGPLTYGIFRPVVLLPHNTDWTDETRLRYILTHEFVHIRRLDALTKLILTFVLCVHWFNPLVWVMYVLANRDLELSCDETVVQTLGVSSKADYALALLGLEEKKSRFTSLFNNFSKSAIEERIVSIMKWKKNSLAGSLLALAVVAGITTAFATSAALSSRENNGDAASPGFIDKYIHELADGRYLIHDQANIKREMALKWAEAWKSRDGSVRYEIMSTPMQSEFRAQQEAMNGDSQNYVIRWSSPWVDSYTVEPDGERTLITYTYTDSTGSQYKGTEWLSYGEENGRIVVTDCETGIEMEQY